MLRDGSGATLLPMSAHERADAHAAHATTGEDAPTDHVGAAMDAVREHVPAALEAGGRVIDQIGHQAPQAVESTIQMVDQSPTTLVALVAGACLGLAAGLSVSRAPRLLALVLAGIALVLGGTVLGRRHDDVFETDDR